MMNFRQLRVFIAVVETGSISAAAQKLHLSQSVISRHVGALEDMLGDPLFDRLPRGVETTEAGRVLADYTRRLFALEDEAVSALRELRDLSSGRLRIGASTTIGNYLLPRALATYHQRYPDVDIKLMIANTQSIQRDLNERRLDIGLTEGFVNDAHFSVHIFHNDDLVPVTAANTSLAMLDKLTLTELIRYPCVMREAGSGTRAVVVEALAQKNLQPLQVMSLGSTEAVKQAVIAGVGYSILPLQTVQNELNSGQLVRLRPRGFELRRPLHLLQLRHQRPSRAVKAFTTLLTEGYEILTSSPFH